MKTEKLSGSIWVSEEEWAKIKKQKHDGTRIIIYYQYDDENDDRPIELTITAKMPERKREFTENELREFLYSRKTISDTIEEAFKGKE